jgi:hypothetical protein
MDPKKDRKTANEATPIRSSAAEYLTFIAAGGGSETSVERGNLGHPYFMGLTSFENLTIKLFEHTP